jgi:hypothetical protein
MVNKTLYSFVCNLIMPQLNFKHSGFGRNEYEALKTALINLFEICLQDEKLIIPIKESLKIFLRNNKENRTDKVNFKNKPKDDPGTCNKAGVCLQVSKEINFDIINRGSAYNEIFKENQLILLELEKLIIDMMGYNKVIVYII